MHYNSLEDINNLGHDSILCFFYIWNILQQVQELFQCLVNNTCSEVSMITLYKNY